MAAVHEAGALPGFAPERLVMLMRRIIAATELDLSGASVLTEAASGAYGVTPIIAALAGAPRVHAFTKPSRYGSVAEVRDWTLRLARAAGVADRIEILDSMPAGLLGTIDIVTNSGHLRPITAALIDRLPGTAVIALMYEAWEFRPDDIDLQAARRRGIPVVGVDERHPDVDVFSFLSPLCVKQLHDCGLPVYRNRIALVCDNDFAADIQRGLLGVGANLQCFASLADLYQDRWDAVIVALTPHAGMRVGRADIEHLAAVVPAASILVQVWGDIDRAAAQDAGLQVWPRVSPAAGHMAVLLSDIGPDAVVRLQTGGLRAAELIWRGGSAAPDGFVQIVPAG